jgi:methylenetetrahydrofolate reductase (NADPH)
VIDVSGLEELLAGGRRVVTAELPIADGASPALVTEPLAVLADAVDAIGVTDNAGAHAHASSLAVASLVRRAGAEPIMNLACRDRNRLALQAELLGASLHGIENVLCVSGDDVTSGDEPQARRVFDLDSPQLLSIAGTLQAGGFLSGRPIEPPPHFFLGAVENPVAPPLEYRAERAAKKVRAGARFFLLQVVFELGPLAAFLERAGALGLFERAFFLPSICIVRSAKQLRYMHEQVAGISVPAELLAEAEALPREAQRAWCFQRSVALAREALALPGVSGLHLIPLGGPQLAVDLLARLEPQLLAPRPANSKEPDGDHSRITV